MNYSYDDVGRLAELTDGLAQRIVAYEYDAAGRVSLESNGNGTTTTYAYDAANQLLHLVNFAPDGTTVLSRFDYAYDLNGQRSSMTTLEGTTEYVYDAAGRLIQAELPGGRILTYAYDAAGNRTTTSDNGADTAYTVNNMNQYLAVGGTSQSFDADGNLVSSSGPSGPRSYSYDAEGQLISVVTAQGTWTYEYDALGNRLASTHNGVRTQYLIDPAGLGDVFGEFDGAGNLQSHYAHGLGLVSRIDAAGPAAYYQFDATGNTAQLTGAGGAVLNSYSYLPFGEALSTSETVPNPFTYVGQLGVMREGNGLDYMRNRWYDSTQGRFTQQDPIGLAGGTNLYAYVGNNPLTFVDPSGLVLDVALSLGFRLATGGFAGQGVGAAVSTLPASATQTTFANSAATEALHAEIRTLMGRQAAEAAARESAKRAARNQYVLLGAEVLVVGAVLGSLNNGLYSLATTGDLPECVLPGVASQILELCKSPAFSLTPSGQSKTVQQNPAGFDPNEIYGPGGFGAEGYLNGAPTLPYSISFENLATAGGPATEITVTEQLDAELDLETFQLGSFGFGDLVIDVPAARQYYATRIDLRKQPAGALTAAQDLFVDVVAELDRTTRVVTWKFTTLDPATLDLPINPFLGFLPPNQTPGEGQGFVNYTVRPILGSPSGTRIDAQASIVFDANGAIETNVFTNTVDVGSPASSVSPLPAVTFTNDFTLSWTGSDDAGGSGIAGFDIYVSDDGGPFTLWKSEPGDTLSDTYAGAVGHTYAFYSVATDNVGHVEPTPSGAQATTTVGIATLNLVVVAAGGTYNASSFTATATATGLGGATVDGSFAFMYYVGSAPGGTGSSVDPIDAGTYTVVAAFTSNDPIYADAESAPLRLLSTKLTCTSRPTTRPTSMARQTPCSRPWLPGSSAARPSPPAA